MLMNVFKQIASSIPKRTGKHYAEIINKLIEEMYICVMRANTTALLKHHHNFIYMMNYHNIMHDSHALSYVCVQNSKLLDNHNISASYNYGIQCCVYYCTTMFFSFTTLFEITSLSISNMLFSHMSKDVKRFYFVILFHSCHLFYFYTNCMVIANSC